MTVNENIKAYRLYLNMTQKELADKLGWELRRYQSYEQGTRELKVKDVIHIAKVLKAPIDKLLG